MLLPCNNFSNWSKVCFYEFMYHLFALMPSKKLRKALHNQFKFLLENFYWTWNSFKCSIQLFFFLSFLLFLFFWAISKANKVWVNLWFLWHLAYRWLSTALVKDVSLLLEISPVKLVPNYTWVKSENGGKLSFQRQNLQRRPLV